MNYNQKVKELRLFMNKSQESFAIEVGCKRGTIAQIELGNQNPTFELIANMISVYKIDSRFFFIEGFPIEPHKHVTKKENSKGIAFTSKDYAQMQELHKQVEKCMFDIVGLKMKINDLENPDKPQKLRKLGE